MAANRARMQIEGTTVAGAAAKHHGANGWRLGIAGLVAAILVAVLVTGVAMHDRQASHPTAPAMPSAVTSQQARFLENNTTSLPNAVTAEGAPVVTSAQDRAIEPKQNAVQPDTVAASVPSPITTQAQQRFWEINTMLPDGLSYPYAEDITPLPGHPR